MNLNKKIKKFTGDGIPAYNEKFNELIEAVNWLAGVRTINGKKIAESDQGPIIDLSQVNTSQPSGNNDTAIDPDGFRAGWRKITLIDSGTGQFFDIWAWSGGQTFNIRAIPWWFDNSDFAAHWLSGAQGELWGTGSYPIGGSANYQQVKFYLNNNDNSSPALWIGNVLSTPIVPPSSGPAFFIKANYNGANPELQDQYPILPVWLPVLAGPDPGITIDYAYSIKYDGTEILSGSGSSNFYNPKIYMQLDPTGWTFDPQGLPGYTYGDRYWVYIYNGPISQNTNPTIEQTFTYSASGYIAEFNTFAAILYTG